MFQYYFQNLWKNGEVEKRNVPLLLPKSMENGEVEKRNVPILLPKSIEKLRF